MGFTVLVGNGSFRWIRPRRATRIYYILFSKLTSKRLALVNSFKRNDRRIRATGRS